MKEKIYIISKLCLLLVIIGFFMPITCELNGFQIAETLLKSKEKSTDNIIVAFLIYIVFISAAASIVMGILFILKRKTNITLEWILLSLSILSGLVAYFKNSSIELQYGGYIILCGWILSFIFLIIYSFLENKKL